MRWEQEHFGQFYWPMAPPSKPGYAEKVLGVISLREEIVGVTDMLFSGILSS